MTQNGTLAYLAGPHEIEMREYEVHPPEPGSILTKVKRANVCGSELHMWSGEHPEGEGVLGHEGVCEITELSDGIDTDYAGEPIEEGDLVAPAYHIACRKCSRCTEGEFHLCKNAYRFFSRSPDKPPHFHGTFSTHYYIHPDQYFYKVPEGVDPTVAAGANCALSQVLFGLDQVGLHYDESVVIQGAGGLGLNTIAVANEIGAKTIVIEGAENRLSRAKEFGADHVIDFRDYDTVEARANRVQELTDGDGADVGVEVAGVPEAFSEGISLLRHGGRYLEMGNVVPGRTTEFDPGAFTRKSINVTTAIKYNPWYLHKALEFLAENNEKYPYSDLVDEEFPLEDLEEALEKSHSREVTRATLIPN